MVGEGPFLVPSLIVAVAGILVVVLWWTRNAWRTNGLVRWRWRLWTTGLGLSSITAVALPIYLIERHFVPDGAQGEGVRGMAGAFLIAPVSGILLGVGKGKQRWLGILSAALSFLALFLVLADLD